MDKQKEREEWLVHIAHDVGALGEHAAFQIVDSITGGAERARIRQFFCDVMNILAQSKDYDLPFDTDEEDSG